MTTKEFRSWWDLSDTERLEFAKSVLEKDVRGWEELKQACVDFGFEPSEDMPEVASLQHMAKLNRVY